MPTGYARLKRRRKWAGSVTMPQIRASTPPTAIPMMRNGNSSSHTSGYRSRAISASGQHRTNRISQSKNLTIILHIRTSRGPGSTLPQQPANGVLLQLHILRIPQNRQEMPGRQVTDAALAVIVGPAGRRFRAQVLVGRAVFVHALQQQMLRVLLISHE